MKSLIIGYGSIGKRHEALLGALGHEVHIVSSYAADSPRRYASLSEADTPLFDYIVIANPTANHNASLHGVIAAGATCPIMVEKPIFHIRPEATDYLYEYSHPIYVGYHLRFHPVTQKLKMLLENETPISVAAYTGQHLSTWRPGTDHKQSYSSHAAQGGGVLRDLSHELDLLAFLLGDMQVKGALNKRVGEVTVDSDDSCMALLSSKRCSIVNMHINYLDYVPRRELIIHTGSNSFHADYITGTIRTKDQVIACSNERNDAYIAMHRAVFSDDTQHLCTAQEGLNTLALIETIESTGAL